MQVNGQDVVSWFLTLAVTLTIPYLFALFVGSKNDQIKDLKEEVATWRREVPNQAQAIKDLTAAVTMRIREGR